MIRGGGYPTPSWWLPNHLPRSYDTGPEMLRATQKIYEKKLWKIFSPLAREISRVFEVSHLASRFLKIDLQHPCYKYIYVYHKSSKGVTRIRIARQI